MAKFLNVRRKTGLFLVALVAILGVVSVGNSFNFWNLPLDLSLVVSIFFIGIVATEFSLMSVFRNRFDVFEWFALAIVVLALIPIISMLFGVENMFLDVYQGTITLVLILMGLLSIFTKQKGEK